MEISICAIYCFDGMYTTGKKGSSNNMVVIYVRSTDSREFPINEIIYECYLHHCVWPVIRYIYVVQNSNFFYLKSPIFGKIARSFSKEKKCNDRCETTGLCNSMNNSSLFDYKKMNYFSNC